MAQEPQAPLQEESRSLTAIVGANVYRRRVLRVPKWSREKLAEASGISEETIRKLEDARYPGREAGVQLSTVEALAKAFEVDPAILFVADTRVFRPGKPSSSAVGLKAVPGRGTPIQPIQPPPNGEPLTQPDGRCAESYSIPTLMYGYSRYQGARSGNHSRSDPPLANLP